MSASIVLSGFPTNDFVPGSYFQVSPGYTVRVLKPLPWAELEIAMRDGLLRGIRRGLAARRRAR